MFKSPWANQETWTLSVRHSDEDAQRYVDNVEAFAQAVTSTVAIEGGVCPTSGIGEDFATATSPGEPTMPVGASVIASSV